MSLNYAWLDHPWSDESRKIVVRRKHCKASVETSNIALQDRHCRSQEKKLSADGGTPNRQMNESELIRFLVEFHEIGTDAQDLEF